MKKKQVSIKVDADLYRKAAANLKERGTDIERWFDLQLRAFANSGKAVLGLRDKMTSGKYEGAVVEDVVRDDTRYAVWMLAQNFSTKYGDDVHVLVEGLLEARKS